MTAEQKTTVRVIVKLRDLDTDAHTFFEHEVMPPRSPGEERETFIRLVAEHKPEAEIRSFANHAASFVDSEHLVIAYFEEPAEIGRVLREIDRPRGQQQLL